MGDFFKQRADRKISQWRREQLETERRERLLKAAIVMFLIAGILLAILAWLVISPRLPAAIAPCSLTTFRYCGCDGFFCWP